MRHRKKKITLDRKAGPRRALLKNLAVSLILFERIITTLAKAKAAQRVVERLITIAKALSLVSRRRLLVLLPDARAVKKLLEVFGPRYQSRIGGYTRIVKIAERRGDGGEQALVEFV